MGGIEKSFKEMLADAKDEKLLCWEDNPNIYKNDDFEITNEGKYKHGDGRTLHHLHVTTQKHPATASVAKLVKAHGGKPALVAFVQVEHGAKPSVDLLRVSFEGSFTGKDKPRTMAILKM